MDLLWRAHPGQFSIALKVMGAGCGGTPPTTASTTRIQSDLPNTQDDVPRIELLGSHLSLPTSFAPDGVVADELHTICRVNLVPAPPESILGAASFQMEVLEYHSLSTGDVLTDARILMPGASDVVRGASAHGLEVAWVEFDSGRADVPLALLGAVVVHPDRTVQRILFLLAADESANRERFTMQAREVVASLAPGPRMIRSDATTVELSNGLFIDIPSGYTHERFARPYGAVLMTRRLRQLGEGPTALMMISVLPSHQFRMPDPPGGVDIEGRLLGERATWRRWVGDFRVHRADVNIGAIRLEFLVSSGREVDERALVTIAETLRRA